MTAGGCSSPVIIAVLAVTGTLLWGLDSWAAWLKGLATEGRYVDTLNRLSDNRPAGWSPPRVSCSWVSV